MLMLRWMSLKVNILNNFAEEFSDFSYRNKYVHRFTMKSNKFFNVDFKM